MKNGHSLAGVTVKSVIEKPVVNPAHEDEIVLDHAEIVSLMQVVLKKGAAFRFRARGWSMSPFIRDGDWITVAPLSIEPLSIGKVAAFIHPQSKRLVVHRLVGKQGCAYLIRGDNVAAQTDGYVDISEILGCVTVVERDGKRVYLGLGVERYVIAGFSKVGCLARLLQRIRKWRG